MENSKRKIDFSVLKLAIYMLADAIIIFISYLFAYLIEYNEMTSIISIFILGVIVFQLGFSLLLGVYKTLTTNFGIVDALRFAVIITATNVVVFVVNYFVEPFSKLSILMFIFVNAFELLACIGIRCLRRITRYFSSTNRNAAATMIIGAGAAGKIAFDELHNNRAFNNRVVCFLDDDRRKTGKRFLGKPVYGPINAVSDIVVKKQIKEVVIAIAAIDKKKLQDIISILSKENVIIRRLPLLTETGDNDERKIQKVSLDELLGREQITFDTEQIREFIVGKKVLITGAGGSIGSELVRQIYSYRPSEITLFDIYENSTYDIQQELIRKMAHEGINIKLNTIIGSTYNEFRVEEIFDKYRPEIVFHAAAYKHVPLMEDSPVEAIRTNCLGTYNVAKMCDKYGALKMVLVSTDKAVRPTNAMGATKRFAEMIIQHFAKKSVNTAYSAVRFGNVLGSNGSVIPLFQEQIKEGGPVTVTHKDIIRYFMTIPEAVSLILQSGAFATGGEIFILDMGEQVKILTLAENIIKQCGYIPYKDIDIVFTGLRPGEKLYEEILIDVKEHIKTDNNKIYIEKNGHDYSVEENMKYISQVFEMTNNDEIKECLRKVVTSYTDSKKFNGEV